MNKKLLILLIVIAVLVVGLWLYQQSKPTAPVVEEPGMVENFPVEGFPVEQGAAPIVEIPLSP